jgi:hypothetical protein
MFSLTYCGKPFLFFGFPLLRILKAIAPATINKNKTKKAIVVDLLENVFD